MRLGTSDDPMWVSKRAEWHVPRVPAEEVVQVRDTAICERAATAYRDHLRRFVNKEWPDAPVLVVRVGQMYLVDDLRSRQGPDAYWEVMVFDQHWKHRICWGGGA
jgi:hypothetical protein